MSKVKKTTATAAASGGAAASDTSDGGPQQDSGGDFESSLAVLESLVERLEAEQLGLDESLKLYEQGMGLAKRCQSLLDDARQKVELIREPGGEPQAFEPNDNGA